MRTKQLSSDNFKPLKVVYEPDRSLQTKPAKHINTSQGISLIADPVMKNATDVKINNSSMLTMTDKKYSRDTFNIKYENTEDLYPYTFVSYMVFTNLDGLYYSPPSNYPKTRYPGKDKYALFLQIQEVDDDTVFTRDSIISSSVVYEPLSASSTHAPNTRLFKFELLDDKHCRIKHDDGYVNTCLTYSNMDSASASCVFSIETDINNISQADLPKHDQIFEYFIHNSRGYIMLSKIINDNSKVPILHEPDPTTRKGEGGNLASTGIQGLDEEGFPIKSLIRIRAYSVVTSTSNLKKLDTTWVKYESDPTVQNSMQLDQKRDYIFDDSHSSLKYNVYYINSMPYQRCNFLLNSQYHNISGDELYINITVLKNHLTPEGRQSENSPFTHDGSNDFCLNYISRDNAQFRTYNKIQSGTNQIKGDDTLHLSYTSNTDTIYLPGDNLTYFHMPESLKPYEWLNINYRRVPEYINFSRDWQRQPVAVPGSINYNYEDYVGLITSGAIPGDDPMTSDKIFKKRANYRYFSNWGDSGRAGNKGTGSGETNPGDDSPQWNVGDNFHGTWLCSWLQACDRDHHEKQYGPVWMDRYYDDTKFSDISQVLKLKPNCVSNYISDHSAFGTAGYIDTPSELTLDRGVLYAYHHIGQKDNKQIINSFSEYIVQEDLDDFTQVLSGDHSPGMLAQDGEYNVYNMTGNTFGKSKVPDPPYGDFRLSFWVHSDDWTKKMGHQLMGNYVNEGFAVINDDNITPVVVIDMGSAGISLRNTDGKKLVNISPSQYTDDVATIQDSNIFTSRISPLGNIVIIANVEGYALITTINLNGAIVNTVATTDVNFTNRTKKISQIATYKPKFDSSEFDVARFSSSAPEEVVYIMYEDGEIGQLNLVTGVYRNPELGNFFVQVYVEGIQVIDPNTEVSIYDGDYTLMVDEDGLPMFNDDKPVYQKNQFQPSTSSPDTIPATYMFWDNSIEKWVITTDVALAADVSNIQGDDVPDQGDWNFTYNGEGEDQPVAKPTYDETLKKPIYINSTLEPLQYTTLFVADDGVDPRVSRNNNTGMFYVIDGQNPCTSNRRDQGGTNRLFYTYNDGVYIHSLTNTSVFTVYGSKVIDIPTEMTINNMKIDEAENIWLFINDDIIAMYDKNFDFNFSVSLTGHNIRTGKKPSSGDSPDNPGGMFDLIKEYRVDGEPYHGAVIYNAHTVNDEIEGQCLVHITSDGVVKIKKDNYVHSEDPSETFTYDAQINKNISNFDHVNRESYKQVNTLTFKFRAKNRFDPNDFVDVDVPAPVNNLCPGWHHFSFGYDAKVKSLGYVYIDGLLFREVSLTSTTALGKHAFTDIMSKISTIGATQGYNNNLLSEYLDQPGYYFIKGCKIKSYRLYNYNLFRAFIKALSREHIVIPDIKWTIPCGRRAHLDHVSKFHQHALPGNKSSDFHINIANTGLSGRALDTLQAELSAVISENKPTTTNNISINWIDSALPEDGRMPGTNTFPG